MAKKRMLNKAKKSYKKTKKMIESIDKFGDDVLYTIFVDSFHMSNKLSKKELDFFIENLNFTKNNLKTKLKKKLRNSPIFQYFSLFF